jgi:hypothetical protein
MARMEENIPLESVVTHTSAAGANGEVREEKHGLFHRGERGRRRMKVNSKGQPMGRVGADGEEDTMTKMGQIYAKIIGFSIITRYFLYVLPLALVIALPIIFGATVAQDAKIGGVRIVWFFTWVECGKFVDFAVHHLLNTWQYG